jgi:hypothetical protein
MTEQRRQRLCFPLRLSPSLRAQASDLAEQEGISLNHFISLAITEKVTRMEKTIQQHASYPHRGNDIRKRNTSLDEHYVPNI